MTLYNINQKILDAIEYGCDPETGEIVDDAGLEALQMEMSDKIENICLFIKDLRAESKALHDEETALAKRRHTAENKADWLTNYVQKVLNGERFKTNKVVVSYRNSQAVVIDDIDSLQDDFLRVKVEPDKTAIKEVLKAGAAVKGAHLEDRKSMTIK